MLFPGAGNAQVKKVVLKDVSDFPGLKWRRVLPVC